VHQLTDFLAQKDQSIFVLMSAVFSPKVHFQFSNKSPTKSKVPTFNFFLNLAAVKLLFVMTSPIKPF
jgi:hypothetical protein